MGNDLEVPVEVIMGTVPIRKAVITSGSPKLTVKAAAREGCDRSPYMGKQRPSTSESSGVRRVSELSQSGAGPGGRDNNGAASNRKVSETSGLKKVKE